MSCACSRRALGSCSPSAISFLGCHVPLLAHPPLYPGDASRSWPQGRGRPDPNPFPLLPASLLTYHCWLHPPGLWGSGDKHGPARGPPSARPMDQRAGDWLGNIHLQAAIHQVFLWSRYSCLQQLSHSFPKFHVYSIWYILTEEDKQSENVPDHSK